MVCWPLRQRRADCSRLAAMFVHDDFGLAAGGAEAVADEIDLGLYNGEIVLRSTLQNETRAEGGKIRDAGDVEKDILRQHRG